MKKITISIDIELEENDDTNEILYRNDDYGIVLRKNKINEKYEVELDNTKSTIPVSIDDVKKALDNFYKSLNA